MRNKIFLYGFVLMLIGLMYLLLYPRKYDVLRLENRAEVNYWELSTGSRIGYTKLEAKADTARAPILYLHGGPGGMITKDIIETLEPLTAIGHDLYLYDQIGSGHSARLNDIDEYSVERHKKDLAAIVSTLNVDKVILIGHSWGSILLTAFVVDHADKVEKLVITGPGPILPVNREMVALKAPDSLRLRAPHYSNSEGNRKAYNIRTKIVRYIAYMTGKKLASDEEADDFFTHLNSELSKSTFCDTSMITKSQGGGGYYSHIMTVKSFSEVQDNRDRIKELEVPLLILRGQCDNQRWGYTQEYLDLFLKVELKIIEGAGHSIYKEAPHEYQELIRAFLEHE